MKVIIEDDEGRRTVVPIVRDELLIGRADDNTIRLSEKNVSRKHARLLRAEGRFFIEDLQSFTGVRVNGERVLGKRTITEGDLIQISEYDLVLQAAPGEKLPPPEDDSEIVDEDVIVTGPIPGAAQGEGEGEPEREKDTSVIRMADVSGAAQAAPRDLAAAEQPRLLVEEGPRAGTEFLLVRSPAAIGRTSENDVALEDPSVSRYHCKLFLDGDSWKLLDNRSAHGVRVNGEPYATCRVVGGDVIEIGKVKLRFLPAAGAAGVAAAVAEASSEAPRLSTPTAVSTVAPAARSSASRTLFVLGAVAVLAIALAVVVVQRSRRAPASTAAVVEDDGVSVVTIQKGAIQSELAAAGTAARAHRYAEALQHYEAAQKAGATAEELRPARAAQAELHDEPAAKKLEASIAAQRFDEAKAQLDALGDQPGWFADQMRARAPAVKKGYVDDHTARAQAIRAQSVETCAAEAQLALLADPASEKAQQLAALCNKSTALASPQKPADQSAQVNAPLPVARPQLEQVETVTAPLPAAEPPAPRQPLIARTVETDVRRSQGADPDPSVDPDAQSKKLVSEGNQKLLAEDFESALGLFERALALKPSQPILATLYRSMGITLTRQGKLEEGAEYYRLYLPLCTNAKEKDYLTRTLQEYEARRR